MNYDFEIKLSSKLSLKSTWDKVAVSRQRFFYTFILIISYQKWFNIKKYKKLIDLCIGYLLCQKRYIEVTNTYMKSTKKNLPWNFIVCIKVGIAECLPKISGLYCRCLFLSKWKVLFFQRTQHCKKCPYSELFWSAFFPHFPAFRLNTERYCVSLDPDISHMPLTGLHTELAKAPFWTMKRWHLYNEDTVLGTFEWTVIVKYTF